MTTPAAVVIGLDAGTTGVKAAAFGLGSSWRHVVVREYPLLQPAPGHQVQDPGTIRAAARDALAECVAALGSAEVLAVSVSAGMHGLMALDEDLSPLTPFITWADSRARDEARALHRSGRAPGLRALTGMPVHASAPALKLVWFARNDPVTWARARWWIGLKDYLLLWLTGRVVTELSSASGTGLLDLSTRGWSAEATALSGVAADQLPPILPTTAVLPLASAAAGQVGLRPGTSVVVGAADGPLGNLGTAAMAPGVAGLSLGTSGAVRVMMDRPLVDQAGTLFCYALTDTAWALGGAISNGGVVLRWAGRELGGATSDAGSDAATLDLAASVPAGSDGLVMLPYLLPERAPLWDPELPGAYLGLRHDHTRAHLVRAAVEGICLQMRIILDRLDAVEPVTAVRATGGVFRSPLYREVMAAMLGRPLHVVGDAEGTAFGAAVLGLVAVGGAPTFTEAAASFTDGQTPPAQAVAADPELVAAYDRLYASVPSLIGALDRVAGLFAGGPARPGGPPPTAAVET
jgi:gluconokinase